MQKNFNLGESIRGSLYSNSNITGGQNSEIAITCSPVPTLTGKPKGMTSPTVVAVRYHLRPTSRLLVLV